VDTFETVRSDAVRLHAELVNASTDPLQPMRLVEAAVAKLDLELHWLPPGDPLLKGARAVFDAQSGSICCEDTGSLGERAILVAHEIGHARIHGASPCHCTSRDIDPSESTEAAPVGLQRVEAYGVRERRELQANVFAREFLVPRTLALDLYLGRKWSVDRIATEMMLRKDIITQQLLDGLLLPAFVESDQPKKPVSVPPPDASQVVAASHRGCAFQVEAGPGTGKTRTLVDRVLGLLSEGVDPAAILILTFSNRAAGELAERIGAVAPAAIPRLWMGTFHAFGLDFIRRHHDKLGLPSDPMLFDRTDTIEILEEILPTLPLLHYRNLWDPVMVLKDIVATISRAKDELHGPASYRELALRMQSRATDDESKEAAEKSLEVARVYELYEQALSARGAVDFGDLVMKPTVILESDQSLRTAAQLRHRHVLVDEYQDVNRASARFLKCLAGDGGRLWVVGDSRQSIYRFRGASSANMALFDRDYPNAQRVPLKKNYRSTAEIVNTFVRFSSEMAASKGMLPLTLDADRGRSDIRPEIRRYDGLDLEADGVAASVEELRSLGVPYREQAVLCRSNSRLERDGGQSGGPRNPGAALWKLVRARRNS
jgi:DNA helicase-2/ATP-dependent DNA helicase PcrA